MPQPNREMQHHAIKHWLDKHTDSIIKDATSLSPLLFPETVHSFRTGTKKLRAILRMIHSDADDGVRLPKRFRKLYRTTGDLRDCHVLLQMVVEDKEQLLPTFAIWLGNKIGDAGHKLKRQHSQKALSELRHQVRHMDASPSEETVDRFFSKRMERIKTIAGHRKDEETLHEMRKEAKDMQYALTCCEKVLPAAYRRWLPMEEKLEQLTDKAGSYNDYRNLLDKLSMYKEEYGPELSREETLAAAHAANAWTKAKALRRKDLYVAIKELVSPKLLKLLPTPQWPGDVEQMDDDGE